MFETLTVVVLKIHVFQNIYFCISLFREFCYYLLSIETYIIECGRIIYGLLNETAVTQNIQN